MAHYAIAGGLRCAVRRIHGHWLNGREIRDMRKFFTPLTGSVEQISLTDTTELVPLTDAELDVVAGGSSTTTPTILALELSREAPVISMSRWRILALGT